MKQHVVVVVASNRRLVETKSCHSFENEPKTREKYFQLKKRMKLKRKKMKKEFFWSKFFS
jgi:hypothetical protein